VVSPPQRITVGLNISEILQQIKITHLYRRYFAIEHMKRWNNGILGELRNHFLTGSPIAIMDLNLGQRPDVLSPLNGIILPAKWGKFPLRK